MVVKEDDASSSSPAGKTGSGSEVFAEVVFPEDVLFALEAGAVLLPDVSDTGAFSGSVVTDVASGTETVGVVTFGTVTVGVVIVGVVTSGVVTAGVVRAGALVTPVAAAGTAAAAALVAAVLLLAPGASRDWL